MATLYVIRRTMADGDDGRERLSERELAHLADKLCLITAEDISAETFGTIRNLSTTIGEIDRIVLVGCFSRAVLNLPGITQGCYYYLVDWRASDDYPQALKQ